MTSNRWRTLRMWIQWLFPLLINEFILFCWRCLRIIRSSVVWTVIPIVFVGRIIKMRNIFSCFHWLSLLVLLWLLLPSRRFVLILWIRRFRLAQYLRVKRQLRWRLIYFIRRANWWYILLKPTTRILIFTVILFEIF